MPKKPARRRPNPRSTAGDSIPRDASNPLTGVDSAAQQSRNRLLDALRGLAILLMILDHVAVVWMDYSVQNSWTRFATRLAMPLFCMLMGYFLPASRSQFQARHWRRFRQIVLTFLVVNLVFVPAFGHVEILGGLLISLLACFYLGSWFPALVVLAVAYPIDPTPMFLDFPLTTTLSFVAQGSLMRRFGLRRGIVSGILLTVLALLAYTTDPASSFPPLFLFALPSTLLIAAGVRFSDRAGGLLKWLPGWEWLGQHPLQVYAVQYYFIFGVAWWLGWWRYLG